MIRRPSFLRTFFSLGTGDIQTLSPGSGVTAGHLPGLTNGSFPGAGFIGQNQFSNVPLVSAVSQPTTATPITVTSIALPGGVYLISGQVEFVFATATVTQLQAGISFASATFGPQSNSGGWNGDTYTLQPFVVTAASPTISFPAGCTQPIATSSATVYLVAAATFSAGTVSIAGTINALRVG